ncbi:MAG: hypothetical protein QOJ33_1097, partial [Chloroflexota bacterium]|nr:hypothetical protein [Chloroflexota bacterium]
MGRTENKSIAIGRCSKRGQLHSAMAAVQTPLL